MLIKLTVSVERDDTHCTTEKVSEQEELVVGRDMSVDVQIPYTRVSRRHCAIRKKGAQYFVVDLGSSHGTMLGERKLVPNEPVPLRDGDALNLGGADVRVSFFEADSGENTAKKLIDFIGSPHSLDPYVEVLSGRHKDQSFSLQGEAALLLGRDEECNIVIDDAAASRRHGVIKKDLHRGVVFECLGARNETLINGTKLPRSTSRTLEDRDVIQIGDVRLMYANPGEDIDRAVSGVMRLLQPESLPLAPPPSEPETPAGPESAPVAIEPPEEEPASNPYKTLRPPSIAGLATLNVVEEAPAVSRTRSRDLALTFAGGVVVGIGFTLLALLV